MVYWKMCEMALLEGRLLGRYFGSNASHPAAQGYLECQGTEDGEYIRLCVSAQVGLL